MACASLPIPARSNPKHASQGSRGTRQPCAVRSPLQCWESISFASSGPPICLRTQIPRLEFDFFLDSKSRRSVSHTHRRRLAHVASACARPVVVRQAAPLECPFIESILPCPVKPVAGHSTPRRSSVLLSKILTSIDLRSSTQACLRAQ